MKFDSIDSVLDFAIQKEQDAADFYTDLSGKMDKKHMKKIFEQFAGEEKGHKAKLERVKAGRFELSSPEKTLDLKIAENLVDVELDSNLDYQQALIAAMKAEKAAYMLYSDLAELTNNADVKQLFLGLAQEEAKHKMRFEVEYDENILDQN